MTSLFSSVRQCMTRMSEDAATGGITAEFLFPSTFCGFSGHFPGNPVLPGIAQIMAATVTAAGGKPYSLLTVKRCKFVRPVLPGEAVRVSAVNTYKEDVLHCSVRLHAAQEPCAEMTLRLQAST